MRQELFINGKSVDLSPKSQITFAYKSNLLGDITGISTNFSYTIKIRKSLKNQRILGMPNVPNYDSDFPRRWHNAEYRRNGITIFNGSARHLLTTEDDYEIQLIWGELSELMNLLTQQLNLNEYLDDNTFLEWSQNSQIVTSNKPTNYGFINYNRFNREQMSIAYYRYNLSQIHPSVVAWHILEKIQQKSGLEFVFKPETEDFLKNTAVLCNQAKINKRLLEYPEVYGERVPIYYRWSSNGNSVSGMQFNRFAYYPNSLAPKNFRHKISTSEKLINYPNTNPDYGHCLLVNFPCNKLVLTGNFNFKSLGTYSQSSSYYYKWILSKLSDDTNNPYTDIHTFNFTWSQYDSNTTMFECSGLLTEVNVNLNANDMLVLRAVSNFGNVTTDGAYGPSPYDYVDTGYMTIKYLSNNKDYTAGLNYNNGNNPYFNFPGFKNGNTNIYFDAGTYFPIFYNLPKIKLSDFIKNIGYLTGTWATRNPSDPLNKITFVPMNELYDNQKQAVDWSKKYVKTKETKHQYLPAQRNIMQYANDDAVSIRGEGSILVDNDTIDKEAELFTMAFSASEPNNLSTAYIVQYEYIPEEKDENNNITEYEKVEYTEVKPRICNIRKGLGPYGHYELSFNGMSFENLIPQFYKRYQDLTYKPKVIKAILRLHEVDLKNLDYTKPIHIVDYGRNFGIISIQEQDSIAEADLLQITID